MPVRFTKDPAFGMFTANISNQASLSDYQTAVSGLPIERVAFVPPVFLNFYLKEGWQQEALRQILQNAAEQEPVQVAACFDDFEIQYAYNRICNQLELLTSLGYAVPDADTARLELLTTGEELRLMEQLATTPDLAQISKCFHQFFNTSPIRGESMALAGARLALVQACRNVFELF